MSAIGCRLVLGGLLSRLFVVLAGGNNNLAQKGYVSLVLINAGLVPSSGTL